MANPLYDTLFGRHAGKTTPFIHLADGRCITHSDFLEHAAQIAHALTALGLNAGDRLAAQVEKSPEALALYAACAQTGVVFLPLNTAYTPNEVSYFVKDSGASLIVCGDVNEDGLTSLAQDAGIRIETLNADGCGRLMDRSANMPTTFEPVDRSGDDLAGILYTSGTTGRSKGAMITQTNLISNAQALAESWHFGDGDVLLHALPIFHVHGLFAATNVMLVTGGSMIFLPKFDLDIMIQMLPKATAMMGVPTFYTRLLSDPRFDRDLTKHMRLFISGSAPLLAETHIQFEKRTGHRILERYGMTETNLTISNPYDGERRAGTVGLPLPGIEVKITDSTGSEVSDGEVGLIEVRGPNVFKGYWQMPEKTREELRENGFFITGDLGIRESDGYITIVGRDKDLIISGGYNIYPKEVELALDAQPGVLESAVIGVPHPDFGESVVGVLVAQGGAELDIDAITDAVGQSLARFKHPRKLVVLDELPRNSMGKVQKNLLRNQFADAFTLQE